MFWDGFFVVLFFATEGFPLKSEVVWMTCDIQQLQTDSCLFQAVAKNNIPSCGHPIFNAGACVESTENLAVEQGAVLVMSCRAVRL